MKKLAIAFTAALALPACATLEQGRPIAEDRIQDIIPGRTKPADLNRMLGAPHRTARMEDREVYTYLYLRPGAEALELVVTIENDVVSAVHYTEAARP